MSCVTTLEENCWNLAPALHWNFPYVHFPFADFALYHFIVIDHSCEYMLNHLSPPRESATWGSLLNPDIELSHVSLNLHFPTGW